MNYTVELDESLRYLGSPEAHAAIEVDPYWPKWHSPWWHMLQSSLEVP